MKLVRVSVMALCAMSLFASCNNKKATESAESMMAEVVQPRVKLASVSLQEVDQLQVYAATVVSDVKNNIAPAAPSRIEKIFVEVGDNVTKGQKLVQMDESNLKQMKLQISNMEVEFNRIDELYKVGGVSKAEWDNMKLQLEVNKTSYNNLLENTQLLSPIDGVVTARNYDDGDLYSGQAVLVVQKIAPVKLTINVSEIYFARIKKGNKVMIEADAYLGEQFEGTVSLIYPTIDPMSHTFAVEVSVANTDKKIRPGMFARATVNLGTEQHVVVPDVAIVKRAGSGERFVYVYRDGKVWFQPVQLGQRLGDKYELLSGVEDNAQIVIAGQANLSDGIEVIVEK
jgi:RND family efflux transporter MFP subunit